MRHETAQIRIHSGLCTGTRTQEQALLARIETLPGLRQVAIGRNLAGSWGAGDYTLDLQFDPMPACPPPHDAGLAAALNGMAEVDRVAYSPISVGLRAPRLRQGIWRTLMFRVRSEAPDWQVRGLEQDLLRMPDYMPGILNWRLARVLSPNTWTHVWQQEFASAEDLLGEYLMHPFHWGRVDRWFDPEFPEWTVQAISHAFCPLATSLIANHNRSEEYAP
ncbi:Dabb family protein [Cupriavidus consociatus]|uniref:Dabb family protein n=1 Tax=Cupriavidus consociatus TaxID=2821357 RepID=UPI001AE31809|nr:MULTISPECIES: Dabb family protein [unclassified Cupriavidus]MBP0619207.1 Dabb family protein [Cupriavidus sp. LEh25]MDK2655853.1 Dabb family protein [Cupriavidus sp. LEh21]